MPSATSAEDSRTVRTVPGREDHQLRHRRRRPTIKPKVNSKNVRMPAEGGVKKQKKRKQGTRASKRSKLLQDQVAVVNDVEARNHSSVDRRLRLDDCGAGLWSEPRKEGNPFSILQEDKVKQPTNSFPCFQPDSPLAAMNPSCCTAEQVWYKSMVANETPSIYWLEHWPPALLPTEPWLHSEAVRPQEITLRSDIIGNDLKSAYSRGSTQAPASYLSLPSCIETGHGHHGFNVPGSFALDSKSSPREDRPVEDLLFDANPIPDEYNIDLQLHAQSGRGIFMSGALLQGGAPDLDDARVFAMIYGQEPPNPDFESYRSKRFDSGQRSFNPAALPLFTTNKSTTKCLDVVPYAPNGITWFNDWQQNANAEVSTHTYVRMADSIAENRKLSYQPQPQLSASTNNIHLHGPGEPAVGALSLPNLQSSAQACPTCGRPSPEMIPDLLCLSSDTAWTIQDNTAAKLDTTTNFDLIDEQETDFKWTSGFNTPSSGIVVGSGSQALSLAPPIRPEASLASPINLDAPTFQLPILSPLENLAHMVALELGLMASDDNLEQHSLNDLSIEKQVPDQISSLAQPPQSPTTEASETSFESLYDVALDVERNLDSDGHVSDRKVMEKLGWTWDLTMDWDKNKNKDKDLSWDWDWDVEWDSDDQDDAEAY